VAGRRARRRHRGGGVPHGGKEAVALLQRHARAGPWTAIAAQVPCFHYCKLFRRRAIIAKATCRARDGHERRFLPEHRLNRHDLDYDDLLRIVDLVKSSEQFSEFRLKVGDIEIELRRRHAGTPSPPGPATVDTPARADGPSAATTSVEQGSAPSQSPRVAPSWSPTSFVVRAPMMGTFYQAPEPGAPAFVGIGDSVESDTIVCIIEVMKLMNSIPAGARGVVSQVLVDDGAQVDAGSPLIVVDPASVPMAT
jgi:acetyl-CoA carboxylase biotin carboxyl carrier protein